jgi:hypothetical protein
MPDKEFLVAVQKQQATKALCKKRMLMDRSLDLLPIAYKFPEPNSVTNKKKYFNIITNYQFTILTLEQITLLNAKMASNHCKDDAPGKLNYN